MKSAVRKDLISLAVTVIAFAVGVGLWAIFSGDSIAPGFWGAITFVLGAAVLMQAIRLYWARRR